MNIPQELIKKTRVDALKAKRKEHEKTSERTSSAPGENYKFKIPKFGQGHLLVPGSLKLIADINTTGPSAGNTNTYVDNIGRAIVAQRKISYAGSVIDETTNLNVVSKYMDLFATEEERDNMIPHRA